MAITQVGTTTTASISSGGSGALAINKPASVAVGDVLTAGITSDSTTPTAPSGWTQFDGGLHGSASWNVNLYYRVVTGSEGSSFTWTCGTVGPAAGYINAWRNVEDSPDPIAAIAEQETTTSTEPNTGPSLDTSPFATGRLFYVRAIRQSVGDGTASAADLTEATAGITRQASVGNVSGSGNTAYTIGQFSNDTDFSSATTYPGLAVSCNITEATNWEFTYALTGIAATNASGGTVTLSTTANKPTPAVKTRPTVIG